MSSKPVSKTASQKVRPLTASVRRIEEKMAEKSSRLDNPQLSILIPSEARFNVSANENDTTEESNVHPTFVLGLGQFTGAVSRSVDLGRCVKTDELLHSKIPSIFDHTVLNSSTIESYYQLCPNNSCSNLK